MPEFANSFSGLANDRKITKSELIRAIRYSIAAEYEAIQLYEQLAESTDNVLARKVLLDIAREEVTHAGEFLKLLKELAPNEQALYDEGQEEVEEMMAELSKKPARKSPGGKKKP
jgi:rubrerythrin